MAGSAGVGVAVDAAVALLCGDVPSTGAVGWGMWSRGKIYLSRAAKAGNVSFLLSGGCAPSHAPWRHHHHRNHDWYMHDSLDGAGP